jgi:hypothetical protein
MHRDRPEVQLLRRSCMTVTVVVQARLNAPLWAALLYAYNTYLGSSR